MSRHLEAYLDELQRELRCRGVLRARIVEEVRGHVLDAVEAEVRQGTGPEAAVHAAIERFGPARALAVEFAAERSRTVQKILFTVAVSLGLLLGYLDSRPTWDDTGISAGLLFISSGILGALGPRRPWLWALCVGIWIPLFGIFAGAYGGMLVRRAVIPT
jgi:hypothetical protein